MISYDLLESLQVLDMVRYRYVAGSSQGWWSVHERIHLPQVTIQNEIEQYLLLTKMVFISVNASVRYSYT